MQATQMTITITAIDPPVVTSYHLSCLLGFSTASLSKRVAAGQVPRPDARTNGNAKLWKLSTIRAWRPDIADAATDLINRRPIPLYRPASLPTAA